MRFQVFHYYSFVFSLTFSEIYGRCNVYLLQGILSSFATKHLVKLALLRNTMINMKSFCLSRKFQCHLYFFWQCKNDLLALLSGHKTDKSRLLRLFPDLNVFISFDQENIRNNSKSIIGTYFSRIAESFPYWQRLKSANPCWKFGPHSICRKCTTLWFLHFDALFPLSLFSMFSFFAYYCVLRQ